MKPYPIIQKKTFNASPVLTEKSSTASYTVPPPANSNVLSVANNSTSSANALKKHDVIGDCLIIGVVLSFLCGAVASTYAFLHSGRPFEHWEVGAGGKTSPLDINPTWFGCGLFAISCYSMAYITFACHFKRLLPKKWIAFLIDYGNRNTEIAWQKPPI